MFLPLDRYFDLKLRRLISKKQLFLSNYYRINIDSNSLLFNISVKSTLINYETF